MNTAFLFLRRSCTRLLLRKVNKTVLKLLPAKKPHLKPLY